MSRDYSDLGLNDQLRSLQGIAGRQREFQDSASMRSDFEGGGLSARNLGFNYNMTTYGYAENFDSSFDFILPFYVDPSVVKIQKVMLNLLFSKYRGFTKTSAGESSHTHSVTIPSHQHNVTIPSLALSGTATGEEGTGETAHQHGSTGKGKSSFEAEDVEVRIRSLGANDNQGYPKFQLVRAGTTADFRLSVGYTDTAHSHSLSGITAVGTTTTSAAGGGTVVASASGSEHSHAMTYGIYEDTYASNVSVSVISGGGTADVTTAIGGPFNPSAGTPNFYDLDITKYVKGTGLNVVNITTDTNGRVFPVLWVKSVIGG